jgi:hypothetical protein
LHARWLVALPGLGEAESTKGERMLRKHRLGRVAIIPEISASSPLLASCANFNTIVRTNS